MNKNQIQDILQNLQNTTNSVSEFVITSRPSNIALIKYMGKSDVTNNRPTNSSLSYTLTSLRTFIRISYLQNHSEGQDVWRALDVKGLYKTELSDKGKSKFLNHFKNLKNEFKVQGNFLIESGNNFPSDCGLASSASSFAALTEAAFLIFNKLGYLNSDMLNSQEMAKRSRKGSGSSCRSFFEPWACWTETENQGTVVVASDLKVKQLLHSVIVVNEKVKMVSSSEAHVRVQSSALFENRIARAEKRLQQLMDSLNSGDWNKSYELCWAEFWDMHALFESSEPSFGYINADSMKVLEYVRQIWQARQDGPLVTMDAGPNVHLLFRVDQKELQKEMSSVLSGDSVKEKSIGPFKVFNS